MVSQRCCYGVIPLRESNWYAVLRIPLFNMEDGGFMIQTNLVLIRKMQTTAYVLTKPYLGLIYQADAWLMFKLIKQNFLKKAFGAFNQHNQLWLVRFVVGWNQTWFSIWMDVSVQITNRCQTICEGLQVFSNDTNTRIRERIGEPFGYWLRTEMMWSLVWFFSDYNHIGYSVSAVWDMEKLEILVSWKNRW